MERKWEKKQLIPRAERGAIVCTAGRRPFSFQNTSVSTEANWLLDFNTSLSLPESDANLDRFAGLDNATDRPLTTSLWKVSASSLALFSLSSSSSSFAEAKSCRYWVICLSWAWSLKMKIFSYYQFKVALKTLSCVPNSDYSIPCFCFIISAEVVVRSKRYQFL